MEKRDKTACLPIFGLLFGIWWESGGQGGAFAASYWCESEQRAHNHINVLLHAQKIFYVVTFFFILFIGLLFRYEYNKTRRWILVTYKKKGLKKRKIHVPIYMLFWSVPPAGIARTSSPSCAERRPDLLLKIHIFQSPQSNLRELKGLIHTVTVTDGHWILLVRITNLKPYQFVLYVVVFTECNRENCCGPSIRWTRKRTRSLLHYPEASQKPIVEGIVAMYHVEFFSCEAECLARYPSGLEYPESGIYSIFVCMYQYRVS